jgi:dTDP-4-dehydrorhamnose 3,5-epimerase
MITPHKIELAPAFAESLSFESYPSAPQIEGVWTYGLKKNRSENGAFMEYARLGEDGFQNLPGQLQPRQISVSWAAPGRINAFHIHVKEEQNEIWCVIQGQLMVWLIDCRQHSPTLGIRRKLVLSGEQPTMVHIPSGVAHGYRAAEQGATLLYSMDAQFNIIDPNEGRLAWDYFGSQCWESDQG